jgi:DNA repair exonuclease SbcCD nuclease subunit
MLIAHSADHHLGFQRFAGSRSALRKQDFLRCFTVWIDEVIERDAGVAVLAGDLFNSPDPDNESLFTAVNQLMRLVEHGIEVIAVSGNHDTPKSSRAHIYQTLDRLPIHAVYNEEKIVSLDCDILAVPWFYGTMDWEEYETPDFNHMWCTRDIMVIHTPSSEFNSGDRTLCGEEIADRWAYMALGDWHKRCNPVANAWYSGALEHCSFGEQDEETGAIFYDTETGEVEFWDSPSREMVTLEYHTEEGEDVINQELEKYSNACVRLRLTGSTKLLDITAFEWHPLLQKEFIGSDIGVTGPQFTPGNLIKDWDSYCELYEVDKQIRRYGKVYLN